MEVQENEVVHKRSLLELDLHVQRNSRRRWRKYINPFSVSMLLLMVLCTIFVEMYAAGFGVDETVQQQERLADNDKFQSNFALKELLWPFRDSSKE